MADINTLTAKMRAGTATPAEIAELKGLLSKPKSFAETQSTPSLTPDTVKAGMQAQAKKELSLAQSDSDKPTEQQLTGREDFPNKRKIDKETKGRMEKIAAGDFSEFEGGVGVKPAATPTVAPTVAKPIVAPKATSATITKEVTLPKEEIKAAIADETSGEDGKKLTFGEKIKKLATTYGVPVLEILQAVGYQRGGIDKPTLLEQEFQAKLDKEEKDYMDRLEEKKLAAQQKYQNDILKQQQDFEANQASLDRIAAKEAAGAKLTAEERLLGMQLAAQGGSSYKAGYPKPLIPE